MQNVDDHHFAGLHPIEDQIISVAASAQTRRFVAWDHWETFGHFGQRQASGAQVLQECDGTDWIVAGDIVTDILKVMFGLG